MKDLMILGLAITLLASCAPTLMTLEELTERSPKDGQTGSNGSNGLSGTAGTPGKNGTNCPLDNDYDDGGNSKVFICHKLHDGTWKTLKVSVSSAKRHKLDHDFDGLCFKDDDLDFK